MSTYGNNLIPKSVEECYATDEVTRALLKWSQDILLWGKIFIILTCGGGLLTAILAGMEAESFLAFVVALLPFAFSALVEYWVFKFLSFIIYVIASFHENSAITANVALYRAAKEENK